MLSSLRNGKSDPIVGAALGGAEALQSQESRVTRNVTHVDFAAAARFRGMLHDGSIAHLHGSGLPNPSRETKFSGANADREIFIFPVQVDHVQDWQRDPYSCYMCDHTYIYTYIRVAIVSLISTVVVQLRIHVVTLK